MAKVSVIIPTHKGRDLKNCIAGIHNSTYKDYEIIVVDEGLERSAQRNIGIDRATGEYILILDSDMIIDSWLLQDCVDKIQNCNGIYLREEIITPGFFGTLRNWERQFYTGTPIDCVRFVRRKGCPRFDDTMSGPEDRDWDIRIAPPKRVSDRYYFHEEDINFWGYLKKKSYYARSMTRYKELHPDDPVLDWKWRCFGVFCEQGKWKRFLANPIMAVLTLGLIFIRGIIYHLNK